MSKRGKLIGRSRRLSGEARAILARIGELQLKHQTRAVPIDAVIDTSTTGAWDALHALGRRLLIDTVEPYNVRLTRAGWRIARSGG
jgi:hypothetical protein